MRKWVDSRELAARRGSTEKVKERVDGGVPSFPVTSRSVRRLTRSESYRNSRLARRKGQAPKLDQSFLSQRRRNLGPHCARWTRSKAQSREEYRGRKWRALNQFAAFGL